MRQIVECVPNFSEGRRKDVVDQIRDAIESAADVTILDVQLDSDHNRAVISFVGSPQAVAKAAFGGVAKAAALIDLDQHEGEHPRMGAADVIPFVPISGVSMEDCVQLAHQLGRRIGDELEIPVYLYQEAATRPERQNLADVRRGEYEAIKERIGTDPDYAPDYGPATMGAAGATAVGARPPLIAYNVNLGTDNIEIANKIARAVRHSGGGLRYVKALGFEIKERGIVQVSMNMTHYEKTPLYRAFHVIQSEARRYGVPVIGSEIVGLTPANALFDTAEFHLQLEHFDREQQVLENRLYAESSTPDAFLEELSTGKATPGGGSASAVAGAMAASLAHMVAELTLGQESYAEVEEEMRQARDRAGTLRSRFSQLAKEDIAAFESVMDALRMQKDTEEQRDKRNEAIQNGLREAIRVPMETARASVELLRLARGVARQGNVNAITDIASGAHLAMAAIQGAALNVLVNADDLGDESDAQTYRDEIAALEAEAGSLLNEVLSATERRT